MFDEFGTSADTTDQQTPDTAISTPYVAPSTTPTATTPASIQQAPDGGAMVPSYRLREVRETALRDAQTQWAQREAAYAAQLEQVQNQLYALVGVTPQEDPNVAGIRQQFGQLYPGLSRLEERAADLLGVIERSADQETQQRHYWQSYGRQSMDRLYSLAEQTLGGNLSDDGRRALHASFLGYVSSSPDLTERYTSDPTLVDEFWRGFSSSLIDPVRRTAAASMQQTAYPRYLPQDTPSGAPRTTPVPQPANLDERLTNAWAAYQAHRSNQP